MGPDQANRNSEQENCPLQDHIILMILICKDSFSRLHSLEYWDCEFESHSTHRCMRFFLLVCCSG
jgi:hypothetical protein